MKFIIHHLVTDPPHYELMFDNGESLETLSIPEDSFFDLISGCAVGYEKIDTARNRPLIDNGPLSCDKANVEIADQGDYTLESENKMVLNGNKIRGTLALDPGNCTIEIIAE